MNSMKYFPKFWKFYLFANIFFYQICGNMLNFIKFYPSYENEESVKLIQTNIRFYFNMFLYFFLVTI